MRNKILKALLAVFCFCLLALHLAKPIYLVTADIGRHIKNGELILAGQTNVLYTNFYSFTCPNYPFINHHWFFGVISHAINQFSGFIGLSVTYILMLLGAFLLFFRSALSRGNLPIVLLLSFMALPLMADRVEIRPEGVSLLFMGLYFYILTKLAQATISKRLAYTILCLAQLVWVNTHIFFFMGPLLVAVFMWEGFARGCKPCVKNLKTLLCLTLGINLINPAGLAGALTPFNILKEFGYRLAENQNVFFMMQRFKNHSTYEHYLVLVGITLVLLVWAMRVRGFKIMAPFAALAIFFALAGIKAVRLIAPFGFFFVPLCTFFYSQAQGSLRNQWQNKLRVFFCVAAFSIGAFQVWSLRNQPFGLGLAPYVNRSAEFFKSAGIEGPIASNYDIGGYLIYHLAPEQKVFVDNRQEAFPPEFFKQTYVPMQEDEAIWKKVDSQYGFNAIYFHRHDLTPWGQNFLVQRVKDAQWAPVFVDDYVIILLRRNDKNQALIKQFELPQSMFSVRQ
jgi:hypothetical protein